MWHGFGMLRVLRSLESMAEEGAGFDQYRQGTELLRRAEKHSTALRLGLTPLFPIFNLLEGIPVVGKPLGQVEPVIIYASNLAGAVNRTLEGIAPILAPMPTGSKPDPLSRRLLGAIEEHQDDFRAAEQALAGAEQVRGELDPSAIPGKWGRRLRSIDSNFNQLQAGIRLLGLLPGLGGKDEPQTYLLVVQNNDELRASGGFISAFGILEVRDGQVVRFDVQDSYAVDNFTVGYPPPPEPIATYMLAGYWVPRDANWSPDFPTAAKEVSVLYALSTGIEPDGVIAVDQTALAMILQAVGPVDVAGTPEPVGSHNLISWMQQSWSPDVTEGVTAEWWQQRKSFMSHLGSAILERVMNLQDDEVAIRAGMSALGALKGGHLLLYFEDREAQSGLAQSGLDGAIRASTGDFLMVVDSNIGFNKADARIDRSIEYQVDLTDPASPRARLVLEYAHQSKQQVECLHQGVYGLTYAELQDRCYWDYWRVLTAGDSRLTSTQVPAVPGALLLNRADYPGVVKLAPAEGGTTEFAGLLVLPTASSQQLSLEWQLPERILTREKNLVKYSLHIQKQPGLQRAVLRITVFAPTGLRLRETEGWQEGNDPGTYVWKGTLEENLSHFLVFE